MQTKEIDELVDINLKLHKKGTERFNTERDYFTLADIIKFQNFLSERFTNFNGGFGLHNAEKYIMESPAPLDLCFTFCTDKQLKGDALFKKRNNLDYPFEFNKMNFVETFSWLEMIIFVCKDLNIEFRYHPDIIDEIIFKSK